MFREDNSGVDEEATLNEVLVGSCRSSQTWQDDTGNQGTMRIRTKRQREEIPGLRLVITGWSVAFVGLTEEEEEKMTACFNYGVDGDAAIIYT